MDILQSIFSNIWAAILVVLFFGGSIFVHELGHFLAARRRGVYVERFSIGFGPKIFSWKGKSGTEYRLSWLPLGGYVSLPQLGAMEAIEGATTVDLKKLPQPTYGTKMVVFVAGAVFNVIFAFLLACIVWMIGSPMTSTTRVGQILPELKLANGEMVPGPAKESGLREGDVILKVDGSRVWDWMSTTQTLAAGTRRDEAGNPQTVLTVNRLGEILDIAIKPQLVGDNNGSYRMIGIVPGGDMTIRKVMEASPAEKAGLKSGDMILGADGKALATHQTFLNILNKKSGAAVNLTISRDGEILNIPVSPVAKEIDGKTFYLIGIQYGGYEYPSPLKQIIDPLFLGWRVLSALVTPKSDIGASDLSGPIGIGRLYYQAAKLDIRTILWLTILINMNLALFNLLPIPVLDGGHMMFATIAKIFGKPLPQNFIATTQGVFMAALLFLMIYVSYFDVRRIMNDPPETKEAQTSSQPGQQAPSAQP